MHTVQFLAVVLVGLQAAVCALVGEEATEGIVVRDLLHSPALVYHSTVVPQVVLREVVEHGLGGRCDCGIAALEEIFAQLDAGRRAGSSARIDYVPDVVRPRRAADLTARQIHRRVQRHHNVRHCRLPRCTKFLPLGRIHILDAIAVGELMDQGTLMITSNHRNSTFF